MVLTQEQKEFVGSLFGRNLDDYTKYKVYHYDGLGKPVGRMVNNYWQLHHVNTGPKTIVLVIDHDDETMPSHALTEESVLVEGL